jgi:hypothetical protein
MGRFARIASDAISIGALLVFPFFCIYLVVWQPNGGHATPGLALFLFVDLMLICFGLIWLMVGHREFYLHIYARAGRGSSMSGRKWLGIIAAVAIFVRLFSFLAHGR